MSITENFREGNRRKRKIFMILFLVGIILLIGIPFLFNQLLPENNSLYTKPKYLEIQIPDIPSPVIKNKPDSVLTAYLLSKDSVVLGYTNEYKITNLKNIDSFLRIKNYKILLIKASPNAGYRSLVTILDKIKEVDFKKYAIVDFNRIELDSILRAKK